MTLTPSGSAAAPAPAMDAALYDAGLIGLMPVIEIIKTIIYTGQVKGERPASAIIVAPIGSGKTSVMEKIQCEQAEFTGDFTSRDASRILKKDGLTHVMIGDFLSVLGHKAATVALTVNVLSKLTGEKLLTDPFTGLPFTRPLSIGIISGIPPDKLTDKKLRSLLFGSGFASRFLIIKYQYTPDTKRAIHKWIESDAYTKTAPFIFEVERGAYEVHIPPDIAEKISLLSDKVRNDELGARAHRHLRALVKARARMDGRRDVESKDYDFVRDVSDFFCSEGRLI
jgi:hypothetical protein